MLIFILSLILLIGANSKTCASPVMENFTRKYSDINLHHSFAGKKLSLPEDLSDSARLKRNIIDTVQTNNLNGEVYRSRRSTHSKSESDNRKEYTIFQDRPKKVAPVKHRSMNTVKNSRKSHSVNFGDQDILEMLERDIDKELNEELKASGVQDDRALRNTSDIASASEVSAPSTNALTEGAPPTSPADAATVVSETATQSVSVVSETATQSVSVVSETAIPSSESATLTSERLPTAETPVDDSTLCQTCSEVENLILEEREEEIKANSPGVIVQPAFSCDEWHIKTRTCFFDRNVGDTVTFVLAFKHLEGQVPRIIWRQEFHVKDSNARKDAVMDPDSPVWNVVIGSQGREFRMSPITEADVDFNRFSATVHTDDMHRSKNEEPLSSLNKVIFQIRILPVDLGFVYPGEAIMLNIGSFVSLPQESMSYKWYLERDGEAGTLPSNMKTSPSGGSVAISELRKEQEGVLTCSVYTNKMIFATKKRFLIKELFEDVLISMDSRNNPNIQRRSSHLNSLKSHNILKTRHIRSTISYDFQSMQRVADRKRRRHSDSEYIENPGYLEDADVVPSNHQHHQNAEYSNQAQTGYVPDEIPSELNSAGRNNMQELNNDETQVISESYESNEPMAENPNLEPSLNIAPEGETFINDVEHSQQSQLNHQPQLGSAEMEQSPVHDIHHHHNTKTLQHEMEPPKESIHRIHVLENHGERDLTLQIFKETSNKEMKAEDKIARLMSYCQRDTQCSGYAVCIRKNFKVVGFCRCLPGYHGNGLFCWEDVNVRNAPPQDNDTAVSATHSHFVIAHRKGLENNKRMRRMPVKRIFRGI